MSVFLIEDVLSTAVGGVAVRAAGAKRRYREAAAEEPILLRCYEQTRARSALIIAGKLEVPPALHRHVVGRHARTIRDEPTILRGLRAPRKRQKTYAAPSFEEPWEFASRGGLPRRRLKRSRIKNVT